jgi:hypothetical protein
MMGAPSVSDQKQPVTGPKPTAPDQGHAQQNALLKAHGYTWRKITDRVHRGRTYSHWALIGPNGTETSVSTALAHIAMRLQVEDGEG